MHSPLLQAPDPASCIKIVTLRIWHIWVPGWWKPNPAGKRLHDQTVQQADRCLQLYSLTECGVARILGWTPRVLRYRLARWRNG